MKGFALGAVLAAAVLCAACGGASPYSATAVSADKAAAQAMLGDMAQGQDTQAESLFDAPMRSGLPPAALGRAWNAQVGKYGALTVQGTPRAGTVRGDLVVEVPLRMAHGSRAAIVAFDPQGQVAGLHFAA